MHDPGKKKNLPMKLRSTCVSGGIMELIRLMNNISFMFTKGARVHRDDLIIGSDGGSSDVARSSSFTVCRYLLEINWSRRAFARNRNARYAITIGQPRVSLWPLKDEKIRCSITPSNTINRRPPCERVINRARRRLRERVILSLIAYRYKCASVRERQRLW